MIDMCPTELELILGDNIRRCREAAGLTKTELSRRLRDAGAEISIARLGRMEDGQSTVYAYDVYAISRTLGIPCDLLLSLPGPR